MATVYIKDGDIFTYTNEVRVIDIFGTKEKYVELIGKDLFLTFKSVSDTKKFLTSTYGEIEKIIK